jgi:hypothetical protein
MRDRPKRAGGIFIAGPVVSVSTAALGGIWVYVAALICVSAGVILALPLFSDLRQKGKLTIEHAIEAVAAFVLLIFAVAIVLWGPRVGQVEMPPVVQHIAAPTSVVLKPVAKANPLPPPPHGPPTWIYAEPGFKGSITIANSYMNGIGTVVDAPAGTPILLDKNAILNTKKIVNTH